MLNKCVQLGRVHYNNNRWCSVVYQVLDQRGLFRHTKEKFRNTKRNSNVVADLPVSLGYDWVYDLACDSSSPFDFE